MSTNLYLKDNSTYEQKVMLRQTALQYLGDKPVVIETHGGWGDIYNSIYASVREGVVIEKDSQRSDYLAKQRPTWAVYEADSAAALSAGCGAHIVANVLDVDPYGDPWPTIQAYFRSARQMAPKMVVIVNDGLRWRTQVNVAHQTNSLSPIVLEIGNDLYPIYLDVCRDLMQRAIAPADYTLSFFDGYYTGHANKMTHYLAILEK